MNNEIKVGDEVLGSSFSQESAHSMRLERESKYYYLFTRTDGTHATRYVRPDGSDGVEIWRYIVPVPQEQKADTKCACYEEGFAYICEKCATLGKDDKDIQSVCPCGETPKRLHLSLNGQGDKWAVVSGDCCGQWEVEFRTDYNELGSKECIALAIAEWNGAPRGVGNGKQ